MIWYERGLAFVFIFYPFVGFFNKLDADSDDSRFVFLPFPWAYLDSIWRRYFHMDYRYGFNIYLIAKG